MNRGGNDAKGRRRRSKPGQGRARVSGKVSFPRKNPPSRCSHPVYLLSVYVGRQRTNQVARTPYPRLDGVSQKAGPEIK